MDVLNLNSLKEVLPDWSEVQCDYFVEGLSIGLERQTNKSGVILDVKGIKDFSIQLNWEETSEAANRSWREPKKIAESGGTAIAFFLTEKLTEYVPTEESLIGTGVDYWLGFKMGHPNYDEFNFMNARLEISGINKENGTNTLESRLKLKLNQVKRSDEMKIPVYISIAELNTPKAIFILK